ncbi:MAG: permease [Flavobacteriia bacterium]|nr:MAG: permease [Flavobacteriia bacterium]
MKTFDKKWLMLAGLAIVWGSSFILMKKALITLTPIQVGALRVIIAGFVLLMFVGRKVLLIKRRHFIPLFINAMAGTFVPAFLFTYAIEHIDSGIVAILNSLTPLNTFLLGVLFFGFVFKKKQVFGVFLGMFATVFLIMQSARLNPLDNYAYAWLIVLASIGYAVNVNVLKKYLSDLDAVAIAVGNFCIAIVPAIIVLIQSGFFEIDFNQSAVLPSLGYVAILAVIGTALAKIFFNRLVQLSSPLFASSVTYLIPVVALLWGLADGERIHLPQIVAGLFILIAVYLVNQNYK